MAVHPKKKEFITVGEDDLLIIWDAAHKKEKFTINLEYPARVVEISQRSGKYLAIGCNNGYTLIYDYNKAEQLHYIKGRSEKITQIKFSPNSKLIAIGGQDSEIVIYAFNRRKTKKICKIRAH